MCFSNAATIDINGDVTTVCHQRKIQWLNDPSFFFKTRKDNWSAVWRWRWIVAKQWVVEVLCPLGFKLQFQDSWVFICSYSNVTVISSCLISGVFRFCFSNSLLRYLLLIWTFLKGIACKLLWWSQEVDSEWREGEQSSGSEKLNPLEPLHAVCCLSLCTACTWV